MFVHSFQDQLLQIRIHELVYSSSKIFLIERKMILPKPTTAAKLFATGSTVGPLVDALHNQCLLEYDITPITVNYGQDPILCTSWIIPPLLGVAYVVLGGILPKVCSKLIEVGPWLDSSIEIDSKMNERTGILVQGLSLKSRAFVAVLSTALIIRLSEYLQVHDYILGLDADLTQSLKLAIMSLAAFSQWIFLDGTPSALLASLITAIGGPLSELPFVANGCWHYIPEAADYFPLRNIPFVTGSWSDLSLSSITGPCYFAVTMDSISLGRWFEKNER